MEKKISAVYQIVNTVTNDRYVGSSKDVKKRLSCHTHLSVWKRHSNSSMYCDMEKYGVDKFRFQILAPVIPEHLKQVEQEFIEMLKPTYNVNRAKGRDAEKLKEAIRKAHRKYNQSEKGKDANRKYRQSQGCKESARKRRQTEKGKEMNRKQARKDMKKYLNQPCSYNGELVRLGTLVSRFRKVGFEHPTEEAKKYLLNK